MDGILHPLHCCILKSVSSYLFALFCCFAGCVKSFLLYFVFQGVMQMKKTDLNPHYVFIKPPNMEELEKRLRGRNTETEESIQVAIGTIKQNFDQGGGLLHIFMSNLA